MNVAPRHLATPLLLAACACFVSCGSSGNEDPCDGQKDIKAVFSLSNNFGAMFPYDEDDIDPTTTERAPYEWTMLLRTECATPINVSKACILGAGGDADANEAKQFLLEGPSPAEVSLSTDSAIRLTYNRRQPAGVDNVALLIESDADNFPKLVLPLCARVVADGEDLPTFECESPVAVPTGEGDTVDASCP